MTCMESIPGYDEWKCTPPESVNAVVRCTHCGEQCDYADALRSDWLVSDDEDDDSICRGECPVCQEDAA